MSAVDELAVGDGWPGGGSPEQEVGKIGDAPAADPPGCNCVYLGMQQNWDAYQQQLAARQMAKEEISAAESQAEWDFGAWAGESRRALTPDQAAEKVGILGSNIGLGINPRWVARSTRV